MRELRDEGVERSVLQPEVASAAGESLAQRKAALQARFSAQAEALGAVPITRTLCSEFTLYGEPGVSRRDKALLDGKMVDGRYLDLEVFLTQRLSPPHTAKDAAVVYMLAVKVEMLDKKMQNRPELKGRDFFLKAGCIPQKWLMRGRTADVNDEALAKAAVAHSYVSGERLKQPFWVRVFKHADLGGPGSLRRFVPFVAAAKLVLSEEANDAERGVGEALLATPGVVDLRTQRWRASDDGPGGFWHLAGPHVVPAMLL